MQTTASSSDGLRLAALAASVFFTGCVWYVPPRSFAAMGRPVAHSQSALIKPGKTTRSEVMRVLGKPSRQSPHTDAIAYVWERDLGGFIYLSVFGQGGVATPTFGPSRAYVVAFDDRGIVRKTHFISLVGKSTVDQRMVEWAGYQSALSAPEIVPARPPVEDLILRDKLSHPAPRIPSVTAAAAPRSPAP